MWFNNFSDAVIEYRRTRFEAYLTLLVRPPDRVCCLFDTIATTGTCPHDLLTLLHTHTHRPLQLELVNKYPPLRKEVEAFLGVPQTIDPPKRYPKTPIPGRNGRPSAGDKPLALLDDSNTAAGAEAPTGAGALLGRRPAPGRKGSFAAAPLASPTSISSSAAAAGSPPSSPSSNAHGQHHHRAPAHQANPAVTVLVYLFVYILLVGVLATAAALDPAKARNCALAILGLSFGASLLVSRAFAQAHYLQHQQQLHYKAA